MDQPAVKGNLSGLRLTINTGWFLADSGVQSMHEPIDKAYIQVRLLAISLKKTL